MTSPNIGDSPLLSEYTLVRRWMLGVGQEEFASAFRANQSNLSTVEKGVRFQPSWRYLFREAVGVLLIEFGFSKEMIDRLWHEMNKLWVASDHGLFVPEDGLTVEDVRSEIYQDLLAARRDPRFLLYCQKVGNMRKS